MYEVPNVVGYKLNDAKTMLGESARLSIIETITPYEDKKEERRLSEPIIVRQINKIDAIMLTVSFFK